MIVAKAAANTLTIWSKEFARTSQRGPDLPPPVRSPDGTGLNHQHWLLVQVVSEEIVGEKAHRWLSYAQGYLVAVHELTLDQCKYANLLA